MIAISKYDVSLTKLISEIIIHFLEERERAQMTIKGNDSTIMNIELNGYQ